MCEEKEKEDPCVEYKKDCSSPNCNPVFLRELPASSLIKKKCTELNLTDDELCMYRTNLLKSIQLGLKKDTNPTAIVKCFPTYVQDLPDGSESGKFLALDLGGSKFRVLLVTITPGKPLESVVSQDEIPHEIMTGPGIKLFDYIAECLAKFCSSHGLSDQNLPLGFTFSFPLIQKGIKIGILERWTKGFSCEGVIGKDVVQLLQEAVTRRGDLKIEVVAVVNDTTGTLMACAFDDNDCKIGLIVGTGTNGCYVEKQSEAELFDEPDKGSGVVIINMESGAFGDDGALDFCRTQYDIDVDNASINAGRQLHEKMISGMYLGELVRLAAERFTKEGIMFGGKLSDGLKTPGRFETKFVSDIEEDEPCTYNNAKQICDDLGVCWATEQDYQNLRYIASCFSRRAAHMVACLIVVLMRKMEYKQVTIGIDGTLYKNHPHFHNIVMHKIEELLGDDPYKFKIVLGEDGSGMGAALIAAVAAKPAKK